MLHSHLWEMVGVAMLALYNYNACYILLYIVVSIFVSAVDQSVCLICCRYYEVKLLTGGMMRVGWATPDFPAGRALGTDKYSYGFDGFLVST